ncbi:SRPBCC domain-containing protein [Brachybacterium nesterenkovii]|uniref:Aha1 domain protein n=1 Tax=Brachybacterium nesterenkovii TaxID=47847 RepID=A0A1X6WTC3_9MICO|nr:SRPBCC domain-containing protein [Brachybacterium nesterenkovii]SLM88081.1 Aha1 domain protein [Brachybacterium nesterenkovii]
MPSSRIAGIVDAVSRSVEVERGDGTVALTARLRTTLGGAPSELWPELTEADRLAQWYGPVEIDPAETDSAESESAAADATPEADGAGERAFRTVGGAHGRVLAAVPPHQLDLTWEYADNVDRLEIRLDPEEDGTSRLTLQQIARLPEATFDAYGPGAVGIGWDIAILGFVARTGAWRELRLDVPVASPAWLASSEGADMVRAWSIRWAAASVAAGTDVDAARRAENETTRAYGGTVDAALV